MNAKERFYSGMAAHTISQITSSRNQWTSFLTTIGRNYGFTYPEQIMIHAQRPEATLCKEYDSWLNEKNWSDTIKPYTQGDIMKPRKGVVDGTEIHGRI